MNKERLLELADIIEQESEQAKLKNRKSRFSMHAWVDPRMNRYADMTDHAVETHEPMCGTTACLAGWAVIKYGSEKEIRTCIGDMDLFAATAARLLDLSPTQRRIFFKQWWGAESVAEYIRKMVEKDQNSKE